MNGGQLFRANMDCLNLQLLRRCCRPDSSQMDEMESKIVEELLLQYLIVDINVKHITHSLYTGGYISGETFKIITRVVDNGLNKSEIKINKRVISYLTNRVSFVALLWSLSACGYHSIANLLLSSLERARCSTVSSAMRKVPIIKNRAFHELAKRLKFISDSKTFDDPVTFIRHLAIRFRDNFTKETEEPSRRKQADKYFAVLAIELDNFSFMKNRFLSARALASEMKRVVPFTSNPVMNEALLNGRVAEITALSGDVETALSSIQDVVTVILNTEACPESANLFYIQLNVLLHNYERNPSADTRKYYTDMVFNGLRLIRVLDDDIMGYWQISFMMRVIFCSLDLSITGQPVCFRPHLESLETAQYFLSEVKSVVNGYGLRKLMSYYLAMGRLLQIQGFDRKSILYLRKAKVMAKQGKFVEFKNIDEYEKMLSGLENIT